MNNGHPSPDTPPVSARLILRAAATIGLFGGLLFVAWEVAELAGAYHGEVRVLSPVGETVDLLGYALLRDLPLSLAWSLLVGGLVALPVRLRGARPGWPLALTMLTIGYLYAPLAIRGMLDRGLHFDRGWQNAEGMAGMQGVLVDSAIFTLGIGWLVYLAAGRIRQPRRLAVLTGWWATGLALLMVAATLIGVRNPTGNGTLREAVALSSFAAVAVLVAALLFRISFSARRSSRAERIVLPALIGIALVAAVTALEEEEPQSGAPIPSSDAPNVLWIVMDTLRADALSAYGNPRQTTPNLDRLGAQGAVFEQAWSAAPWTLPSHAAMFTGMLPSRLETWGERMALAPEAITAAELFRAYGWRTLSRTHNPYLQSKHRLMQGFDTAETFDLQRSPRQGTMTQVLLETAGLGRQDYGARQTIDHAIDWILEAQRHKRPFFIFLNFMEVHREYGSTPEWGRYLEGAPPGGLYAANNPDTFLYLGGRIEVDRAQFETMHSKYLGDLHYLDAQLGRLFEALDDAGLGPRTIVVVTSDHGEEFGEHGMMEHFFCAYNTLLHVPLIVRYPPAFAAGTRRTDPVQTLDILPTLADLAEIDHPRVERLDGQTLLASPNPSRPVFADHGVPLPMIGHLLGRLPSWRATPRIRRLHTLQQEGWKLIWASDGRHELYRVDEDPGETVNRIKSNPGVAERLAALLEEKHGRQMPF